MKIIVLGAAGFVGSSLISSLLEKNDCEIIGVDDFSFGYPERIESFKEKIDFRNQPVETFCELEINNVSAIVNCAAIAPLPENQISHFRSLNQNVATCGAICDFMIRNGIRKVIHFSSSAVYENRASNNNLPADEGLSLNPRLMYPVSKFLSELYWKSQFELLKLDVTCIRLFNLYGPNQDYFRKQPPLLGYLIKSILKSEPVTLFANEQARRDYLFIDDLVNFIETLLVAPIRVSFDTPNLGSGTSYSVYEIVKELENASGKKLVYEVGELRDFWGKYPTLFTQKIPLPMQAVHDEVDKISISNMERTYKKYGFKATVGIQDGLKKCLEFAEKVL